MRTCELLHHECARGSSVVPRVVVVVGQRVVAGHALDLQDWAGTGIVGVGISGGHDRVSLAESALNIGAVERRGGTDARLVRLLSGTQRDDGIDDAANWSAAVGVGHPT